MRNPRLLIAAVAAALAVTAIAFTAVRAAQPTPVAVVDVQALLDGLDQRVQLERELEQFIAQRQAQLDTARQAMEDARAEVELAAEASPERRDALRSFREAEMTARVRGEAFQTEIQIERGRIWSTLFAEISDAVAQVAQRDGWEIVFQDDSDLSLPEGIRAERDVIEYILRKKVIYAQDSRSNITADVRTFMNNRFNAGN
ncbi:MAG: OmpH family outer membrane protein [Planctomycetota bacterium]